MSKILSIFCTTHAYAVHVVPVKTGSSAVAQRPAYHRIISGLFVLQPVVNAGLGQRSWLQTTTVTASIIQQSCWTRWHTTVHKHIAENTTEFFKNNVTDILYATNIVTDLVGASFNDVIGEMWQLFEIRVFLPHGLRHHLCQLHGGKARRQEALAAEHVDARLYEADRLAQNLLGVRLQLGGQLHTRHVSLQQEIGLDMRVVVLGTRLQLVRQPLGQLTHTHTQHENAHS